jgi:hypothetical protein
VTSVALSAPTSDFAVSGSPITSSGTLGLQWLVPPTSLNVANAIVKRDPTGAIAVDSINATHAINAGSTSDGIAALFGFNASGDTGGLGVFGLSNGFTGVGVFGENMDRGVGVNGLASGTAGQGVVGESSGNANSPNGMGPDGVDGFSHSSLGSGVAAINTSSGDGLFAQSSTGFAAFFVGDVDVDGRLSKAAGSFKIDHPLDPANKYLYHSFVESPDMKNIYDGTVALDASGAAVVHLPNWFSALNRDFRYQLTAIGSPSPNLYVAEEIHGNRFKIAGGKPGAKVSWQVTGTRQDVYANAHRIPVEEAKSEKERGFYLHPELFGAPPEKSIAAARHPMAARVARGERNLTQKSPQVSSAK